MTPDASLYWDMPLAAQVASKYRNHAVGRYMQSKSVYTIPNVHWADEVDFPEMSDVAIDLALDALSAFVPGGPVATRSLSLAAKAGRGAKKISAGGKAAKGAKTARAPRQVRLDRREYATVMSALNNMYHARLEGRKQRDVPIGEYVYTVVIHEFDDYTIVGRKVIE